MSGCDVLSANLENAGTSALGVSEQNAEIQIVGENDSLVVSRPFQDFIICSSRTTNRRPMQRIKAILPQERNHSGDRFMSTRSFTPNQAAPPVLPRARRHRT